MKVLNIATKLILSAFMLLALGAHAEKAQLTITDAWVREAPPGAAVNAGYMTLVNATTADLEIVGAVSKAFEKVEFHEMAMVGGMMKMRELSNIELAKGEELVFEPGGMHLMLKGAKQALKSGDTVIIVLTFKDGQKQTLNIKVKKDL